MEKYRIDKLSHYKENIEEIEKNTKLLSRNFSFQTLLNKIPDIVLILNHKRQIVYSNDNLLKFLGLDDAKKPLGLRPGEVFNCIHAYETEQGCGSTEFCKECGALKSIVSAMNGEKDVQECRIIENNFGGAYDLRVWSSPLEIEGRKFILFSVADISDEKRREVLERVFFHDILNVASSLKGITELMKMELPDDFDEYKKMLENTSKRLLMDIQTQRQLLAAENGSLEVEYAYLNTMEIMNEVRDFCKKYDFAKDIQINISDDSFDGSIKTDNSILGRILINLVKNALEADYPDGEVNIACRREEGRVVFSVANRKLMPDEVKLQIFQRSFSTKGRGRGIGTYSIKLFTEKYLEGKVSFTSKEGEGTVFTVELPDEN